MKPNSQSLDTAAGLDASLRGHLALCREILDVVERENRALHGTEPYPSFDFCQARKQLVPRLAESVLALYRHRVAAQKLDPAVRHDPSRTALLRQNQDLVMKIIVLDRENEQALLRRGLVPATHLPSANRQRPHFVAELYRRQAAS